MIGVRVSGGTRFRIYPQPSFLDGWHDPVTIELPVPPGRIGPGPQDSRMHALVPIGKAAPYGPVTDRFGRPTLFLPPWRGPSLRPALPDRQGHFDHLQPGDPAFLAAHAFACARLVLAIWERYVGPIPWHFGHLFPRLEILCLGEAYENAQCGLGYIELGVNPPRRGRAHSFALNFDVVAHEMGHLIVFALVGVPSAGTLSAEYRGFHEAMADLVALVALLHVDPVVDDVLASTHGNLYVTNELNRFAELNASDEIRTVSNGVKLGEFAQGWADEHDLSLPLSGAVFDILVEVYQLLLVERGILDRRVLDLADNVDRSAAFRHPLDTMYERAWTTAAPAVKQALLDARDVVGSYLAALFKSLPAERVSYAAVGRTLVAIDRTTTGGRFTDTIAKSFAWREIGTAQVGPLLEGLPRRSHVSSPRTFVPAGGAPAAGGADTPLSRACACPPVTPRGSLVGGPLPRLGRV